MKGPIERVQKRKELKEQYAHDSCGEGTKPDETLPSTGFAGGRVRRTRWPDLSEAADRPRNTRPAVWPESMALCRSSGCVAITIKMAVRKLTGNTFLSRKATHHHRLMILISTGNSDVLDLACVWSMFCLLERKKLNSWFLSSFIHSQILCENTYHVPGTGLSTANRNTSKTQSLLGGLVGCDDRGVTQTSKYQRS